MRGSCSVTRRGFSMKPMSPGAMIRSSPTPRRASAALIERRLAGEPVSRILGVREFYGRPFRIDASTLDPRADTETLIEAALAIVDRKGLRQSPLKLLDLGTGSGCLLITLLAELPEANGVGIDVSVPALRLARSNAEALGVGARASFVAGDWLEGIGGAFDLVVANPPYIASGDIAGLSREVNAPRSLGGARWRRRRARRLSPHRATDSRHITARRHHPARDRSRSGRCRAPFAG